MTKPIIVGYDPGTTAALAIVDTGKNVLYLKSKKDFKTKELVMKITEKGSPIIIAGDKSPLPKSVGKLASSLGCKTFEPGEDLSNLEKYNLVRDYITKIEDDHQRDALASALKAHRNYSKLFKKTDKTISYLGLSEFYDKILKSLIEEESRSINDAVNIVLQDIRQKKEDFVEKKKAKVNDVSTKKVEELRKKIGILENDVEILRNYNKTLKKRLEKGDKKFKEQKEKAEKFHDKKTVKENRVVHRLEQELEKRDIAVEKLKSLRKLEKEGYVPIIDLERIKPDKVKLLDKMLDLNDRVVLIDSFANIQVMNDYLIKALIAPNKPGKEVLEGVNFPIMARESLVIEEKKDVLVTNEKDFNQKLKKARKSGFIQWVNGHKKRKL